MASVSKIPNKSTQMPPLAIYIHIPFCQRKCPYCDFNTYAGREGQYDAFVQALAADIWQTGDAMGRPQVRTVFLGGGTPTVLEPRYLRMIFEALHRGFDILPAAEITSEANPGTVDASRFETLRALGVNRLSMGVQSFDDEELRFLGRIHSAAEARSAFYLARRVGFDNINLDFMFGLPEQSPDVWRKTLQTAVDLNTEHLSLYSLTVESGTALAAWVARGQVSAPDPDLAADLYETAQEMLAAAGFHQYEISNWARGALGDDLLPRFASRHNVVYWRNESYLGFGPGAHGWFGGVRRAVLRDVGEYIRSVERGQSYWELEEPISQALEMGETMMLGLRLVDAGVERSAFRKRFGVDVTEVYPDQISSLLAAELIELTPERVRLTPQALLIGNEVFAAFLPEAPD
jgi:oxygen-independent coproporphyrinogen-3 oxidase